MDSCWEWCDELGPEQIVHLHNARAGLRAIVVVDNTACGAAIGGVRMAPDVSLEESARLARAMTLKNAAAGLPHGGAKSVIAADPKMPIAAKESLVRAFACAMRELDRYIPGPDMGTDERCMAWVRDEIGRAVGLPADIGGIPLDEIGATGYGLYASIDAAQPWSGVAIDGARIAVQGFGSVGVHAARFLVDKGAVLVAAADSRGTAVSRNGITLIDLIEHKRRSGTVAGFGGAEHLESDAIVDVECDIWIPAARPDIIHIGNVQRLHTRVVAEGANIALTAEAESILAERGVLVLPDFIANAGGVICAAVEHRGGTQSSAFELIGEKIRENTRQVLSDAAKDSVPPRQAAMQMAERRVRRAMTLRRF
jgi:glutamate dehydrogenase/leucine dehydrogenase